MRGERVCVVWQRKKKITGQGIKNKRKKRKENRKIISRMFSSQIDDSSELHS